MTGDAISSFFPLEFFISETPKSLQGSAEGKARWKESIKAAARTRIGQVTEWTFLDDRPVSVTIYYFALAAVTGDIDNLIKPILDGLELIAFKEDRVVERVLIQRFEPGALRLIGVPTETLAKVVDALPPTVYIRIDDDLSWRML